MRVNTHCFFQKYRQSPLPAWQGSQHQSQLMPARGWIAVPLRTQGVKSCSAIDDNPFYSTLDITERKFIWMIPASSISRHYLAIAVNDLTGFAMRIA